MRLSAWALLSLAWLVALPALAQQAPVETYQHPVFTRNASGTIAVTSTFQSVFAATSSPARRMACAVQNNGSNNMYVFFGPIASASTGTSVVLVTGQSVNCNTSGAALQDQVSITGTSGDAFYAAQQ